MLDHKTTLTLNADEIAQIADAIATQEKILGMQTRAGNNAAKRQLNALKAVMQSIRNQSAVSTECPRSRLGWFGIGCNTPT